MQTTEYMKSVNGIMMMIMMMMMMIAHEKKIGIMMIIKTNH